uniref:Odorant receptor n=1 Tax=Lampronia capitella TaxID=485574 RepID=A0A2Z4EY46_9NEOP|nr:odorant receptor 1 [Lampronia capitella]
MERSKRKDPMKLKHWRWVRFYLIALGMWPKACVGEPRSRAYEYYHKHTLMMCLITLYLQISYIWSHYAVTSFFELGHMLITICMNLLCIVRLLLGLDKAYGPMINTFFTKVHLFNYECHDYNSYSQKVKEIAELFSRYFSMCYLVLLNIAILLFNITPWINNYKNGAFSGDSNITLQASLYIANPFDTHTNVKHWIVLSIYNYYPTYVGGISITATDLCVSLMIFQVMGRIHILENNLKTMGRPALQRYWEIKYKGSVKKVQVEMFSEAENVDIHLRLKQYINDQKLIRAFIDELVKRYGLVLLASYMIHLANGSIILLEILDGRAESLTRYGPLAVGLFGELIIMSTILEHVCTLSDRLGDAVYSTPWECMDTRNQSTVLLFLMRVQTPTVFKAKGLVEVGVKPMASILKTTVSYCAFLKRTSMN